MLNHLNAFCVRERAIYSLAMLKFIVYSLLFCLYLEGLLFSLFYLVSMSHERLYSRQKHCSICSVIFVFEALTDSRISILVFPVFSTPHISYNLNCGLPKIYSLEINYTLDNNPEVKIEAL